MTGPRRRDGFVTNRYHQFAFVSFVFSVRFKVFKRIAYIHKSTLPPYTTR